MKKLNDISNKTNPSPRRRRHCGDFSPQLRAARCESGLFPKTNPRFQNTDKPCEFESAARAIAGGERVFDKTRGFGRPRWADAGNCRLILCITILFCLTVFGWGYGDAVINELMWMGTSLHQTDEFLELRNMTGTAVDFSATPWSIYRQGEFMMMINEGILPSHGYFLICRRDSISSRIIGANMISSFLVLTNSNTSYALYAGSSNSSPLLDVADDGVGIPFSGRFVFADGVFWSMERNDPPGEGNVASSWHVGCLQRGFVEGAIERGTPGFPNYRNIPPSPADSIILSPCFIADDTIVSASAFGIFDPDSIQGEKIVVFDWLIDDSLISTQIDSHPPYVSVCDSSKTLPGNILRVRSYVFDGTDSSTASFSNSAPVHFEKGDLVVNEIAWMGSNRSPHDTWIELFNNSNRAVDFARTPFYISITGSTSSELTLDSGILPRGGFWLISRFEPSNPSCAYAVSPDIRDVVLPISSAGFDIEIHDFAGYLIDRVDASTGPLSGQDIPSDSVKYTMARITPPGDGSVSSNWFSSEVTSGYKAGALERGTPRSTNIRNNPPRLEFAGDEGYIDDMFQPNIGNMDSFFWWRVKYIDLDNEPPDSICLLFDKNNDGIWQSSEVFALYPENPSHTDFISGAIYRRWIYGLKPTETGSLFSIRASDAKTISAYGIPAVNGPIIEPTFRFTIFGRLWAPDTIWGPPFEPPSVVTKTHEMPVLIHSGDTPLEVGLAITQADIFEHSADTFAYSPGGWTYVEHTDSTGINSYALSALFVPTLEAPLASDFNDSMEDLLIGEFRWFDGDTLGCLSDSLDSIIWPKDRLRLAFKFDPPKKTAGFYSEWQHRISVTLRIRPALP